MVFTRVLLIAVLLSICTWIAAAVDPIEIGVSDVSIFVLDSDTGSPDFKTKLSFEERKSVSLSANHLQKLKLSFKLTTPEGDLFSAHQVFLRLKHGSSSEHLFLVKSTPKCYELVLDFLGLVEELHYVSGVYKMELIVGDAKMANSFLWELGTIDLDLPEAPEGTSKAPIAEIDISTRYSPKAEISHIFRAPEKRPSATVSYAFFVFTLLPFVGFLVGMLYLNINLGNWPSSGQPALSAVAFHAGLALILGLYVMFWLKLNLFTTLHFLGYLGIFTAIAGYRILSHLADVSNKIKVA